MSADAAHVGAMRAAAPADGEEASRLSRRLNKAAAAIFLEARSQSELFFALFRRVDTRHRGCISYDEFHDMVRVLLDISPKIMSDEQCGSLWKWVDKRMTSMSTASFLKMMRAGGRSGFLEEHAKLKRKLKLPDWDSSRVKKDAPLWDDRELSFKEREKDREAHEKEKLRPGSSRAGGARRPLGPAWDNSTHQTRKHGALWEDHSMSFKDLATRREADRRNEMKSFRDGRISARGLQPRAE